jgi:putative acetyltransferase
MKIVEATNKDMPNVRKLFLEYQEWLGIDLCFQNFEEELATLPGGYASPKGVVLVAIENGEFIGCVGIRPRSEIEAELKRLYVQPSYRGQSIGKRLFHTAMSKAKAAGYASVVLDTLPTMKAAKTLYIDYGFKEIPAYYGNLEEGAEYYKYVFS